MKKQLISAVFFVAAFLLVTNTTLAANNAPHAEDLSGYIKGTIKSVDADGITITTTNEDIVKQVVEYRSEQQDAQKKAEKKTNRKKKPVSGKARIKQMMNEKRVADTEKAKLRQEKKTLDAQVGQVSEEKKQKVSVKVLVNSALLKEGVYAQGTKVLINGEYESVRNAIVAREVLNKDGQLIRKNR